MKRVHAATNSDVTVFAQILSKFSFLGVVASCSRRPIVDSSERSSTRAAHIQCCPRANRGTAVRDACETRVRNATDLSSWRTIHDFEMRRYNRYSIFATNSRPSNGAKSSSSSPVPTKRVGIPSSSCMAMTTPPFPLPSSFVTMSPVRPIA